MIRDASDPRAFRQWVSLADDGTVAAVHELASGVEPTTLVETTHLYPTDLSTVRVDPNLVASFKAAIADKQAKEQQLEQAVQAVADAHGVVRAAVTRAVTPT